MFINLKNFILQWLNILLIDQKEAWEKKTIDWEKYEQELNKLYNK